MRYALPLLAALCVGAPAAAELAPSFYEAARRGASSVLVADITAVGGLASGRAAGTCLVSGRVVAVERGSDHAPGSRISVAVPCISADARVRAGPFPGYRQDALSQARRGRFFLKGNQLVRRGFDSLEPPARGAPSGAGSKNKGQPVRSRGPIGFRLETEPGGMFGPNR